MKIYVVSLNYYDYQAIDNLHIYSTYKKALESILYLGPNATESDITEYDIDLPNEGEKYEDFYYYNISGENEWSGILKSRPSKVEMISYGLLSTTSAHYTGHGRTLEEAKLNAFKAKKEAKPVWMIFKDRSEFHCADRSHLLPFHLSIVKAVAIHEDRNVCIIALNEWEATGKVSEFLTVL